MKRTRRYILNTLTVVTVLLMLGVITSCSSPKPIPPKAAVKPVKKPKPVYKYPDPKKMGCTDDFPKEGLDRVTTLKTFQHYMDCARARLEREHYLTATNSASIAILVLHNAHSKLTVKEYKTLEDQAYKLLVEIQSKKPGHN